MSERIQISLEPGLKQVPRKRMKRGCGVKDESCSPTLKNIEKNPILLFKLLGLSVILFSKFLTSNLSSWCCIDVRFFKTITLMSLSPKFPWCNVINASFLITSPIWIWDLVILRSCLLTTFGSRGKLSKVTLFLLVDVEGKWKELLEALVANGEGDSKFKWSSMVVR